MKNNFRLLLLITVIIISLILNPWTLESLFTGDGILSTYKKILILLFYFIVISIIAMNKDNRIINLLNRYKLIPGIDDIVLLICSVLILFISIETSLRYLMFNYFDEKFYAKYATQSMIQRKPLRYSSHPYLGWITSNNYSNKYGDIHNSDGFRGEEIFQSKNSFKIVCLGGSTTYGTGVKIYKDSYPYLLGKELKLKYDNSKHIEVINAGVGNYDTWSCLINLIFRIIELKPDMIIYFQGGNDFESRLVYPFDKYKSDNTGRIARNNVRSIKIIDRFVTTRLVFSIFDLTTDYSDLVKLVSSKYSLYNEFRKQWIDGSFPDGIFNEAKPGEILKNNPPIYTKRNLELMSMVCKKYGIKFILSTMAYNFNKQRPLNNYYLQGIKDYNSIVNSLSQNGDVFLFDYASVMDYDSKYWHNDGAHLNKEGNKIKAKLFADYLITDCFPLNNKSENISLDSN